MTDPHFWALSLLFELSSPLNPSQILKSTSQSSRSPNVVGRDILQNHLKKYLQQSAKSCIDREICRTAHMCVYASRNMRGGKTRFSRTEMPPLFCVLDQTKKGAIKVVTSGGGENNNYEMEEVVRRVCVQSRAGRGG